MNGNTPSLLDQLISVLTSYIEYKKVDYSIKYKHKNHIAYCLDTANPQKMALQFNASFMTIHDRSIFKAYKFPGGNKKVLEINKPVEVKEVEEVLKLLTRERIDTNLYTATKSMYDWKDVLSQCYGIIYLHHGAKKVLCLYKNEDVNNIPIQLDTEKMDDFTEIHCNYLRINNRNLNTDLNHLYVNINVDEVHYYCGCVDVCTCSSLNLPKMCVKKFYNNGNLINISSSELWENYKSVEPRYTFQNKYIIVDGLSVKPDYNMYINDMFNKTSTPTGYFYRLDGQKLILTSYEDQNWPLTCESAIELIKLAKKVVFISNDLESAKTDLGEIKKMLPNMKITVVFHD